MICAYPPPNHQIKKPTDKLDISMYMLLLMKNRTDLSPGIF